jgi:hypothetical protein
MPALLLALELGTVQHLGTTAAGMAVLARRVAGLFLFAAGTVALATHASTLVVAREDRVLRHLPASAASRRRHVPGPAAQQRHADPRT